jgi:hypothetical protein
MNRRRFLVASSAGVFALAVAAEGQTPTERPQRRGRRPAQGQSETPAQPPDQPPARTPATTPAPAPVPTGLRVSNVVPLVSQLASDDRLNGVAFSVRNDSGRPIASATFRIIVRGARKQPIDERTQTWSFMRGELIRAVDPDGTVRYSNSPVSSLTAGGSVQVEIPLAVRGFRTPAGTGTVDVQIVEVK